MTDISDLKLRFLGSLVEQLGAQMYPSATATIAELVSNAWDADARNVWVEIPLGEQWTPDKHIVVTDDGIGMSYEDARDAYLNVGRKRRKEEETEKSPNGRLLHGRKGIGKLAAFGTARILEFRSKRNGIDTRFRMDYDAIRATPPGEDYSVEDAHDDEPLRRPDGASLAQGTRIRLLSLRLKRAINEERFRLSMSRRFAIESNQMRVFVNGELITRFDYPVEFRFPQDAQPDWPTSVTDDGWAEETIDTNRPVRWWIGFTEKPLPDQGLQGISVLARGKMAQRPFLFQRAQGVTGQLGQEYLIGEIEADWLDEGDDIETDHIQANRDQLQLEKDELQPFVEWGQQLLKWALSEWNAQRKARLVKQVEVSPELDEILRSFTPRERTNLLRVRDQLADSIGLTADDLLGAMQSIANAYGDSAIRQMWDEIDDEAPDVQSRIWRIIHDFGLIDARRNLTLIRTRLEAIDRLKKYVTEGASEVPEIHEHIKKNAWLIDPRWHLLDDEVDIEDLGISYEREPGSGRDIDFVFALQQSSPPPASADHIIVVEIKRARDSNARIHRANTAEVNKFHQYVLAVVDHVSGWNSPPRVDGRMIAQGYTSQAAAVKRSLETTTTAKLQFQTWDEVVRDSERLHRGWLTVEHRRTES